MATACFRSTRGLLRIPDAGALSLISIVALVVVIAFAFMLGVSDAPNASAVLIASRAASYRRAMAFSFVASAAGGLLAGEAVALTMSSLVHFPAGELAGTYLAGGVASLGFTLLLTRQGVPVSCEHRAGRRAGGRGRRAGGMRGRWLGWISWRSPLRRDRHACRDRPLADTGGVRRGTRRGVRWAGC